MEEAVELSDYLPLSFTSPKEQEYVSNKRGKTKHGTVF